MLFILYAHVAFWVLVEVPGRWPPESPALWGAGLALGYLLVMLWTLNGFFDGLVLAPIVLGARALDGRRPLAALVWFCVAAFLHFRTFFFAPLALAAALELVRTRAWRRFTAPDWAAFGLAAALAASSLATFFLVWPALAARPPENFVNLGAPDPVVLPAYLVAVALTAGILWRARARLDVLLCLWLATMTVCYRYFCPWHAIVAFLPWLYLPLPPAGRADRVRAARLGFVVLSYLLTLV